jgi:4-amino-4-deoxy-L-arabinose transferase-like glycosyltransferase
MTPARTGLRLPWLPRRPPASRRSDFSAIRSAADKALRYIRVLHARADWVATLDGDRQSDPRDLRTFLRAHADPANADVHLFIGHRALRRDTWLRRIQSRIANGVRRWLLHDGTPDTGCGIKLMRRDTFLRLPYFDHMHRFLPALFQRAGTCVVSLPGNHRPRLWGTSKYGLLLAFAVLLIIGSGVGVRVPWPADEPRFALIAHDMVASGDWLFPRLGGELYADKAPLFLWLLSIGQALTGSIRWSFLLPSFLASALLRHLFWGPAWGWYFLSGFAAGLGIITKGVGFLPLLALLPYTLLRRCGFEPLPKFVGGARWLLAGPGLLLAVGVWLVPMLYVVANSHDPELVQYRNDILFHQTVGRYVSAWHHRHPWYYFLLEVIPGLWLPFSGLLFWLVPRWRRAWLERDARAWLPLGWGLLVILFFSLTTGKRGIYILPALPAMAVASAPYLRDLLDRTGAQRVGKILGCIVLVAATAFALGVGLRIATVLRVATQIGLDSWLPFAALAIACAVAMPATWRSKPVLTWPATLSAVAIVMSWMIEPRMDPERSGSAFIQTVQAHVAPDEELALVDYKEQFLLYLERSSVNFGHRLQDPREEQNDAARWLSEGPRRVLLVSEPQLAPCFSTAPHQPMGHSAGMSWFLVRSGGAPGCIHKGDAAHAIHYDPRP